MLLVRKMLERLPDRWRLQGTVPGRLCFHLATFFLKSDRTSVGTSGTRSAFAALRVLALANHVLIVFVDIPVCVESFEVSFSPGYGLSKNCASKQFLMASSM